MDILYEGKGKGGRVDLPKRHPSFDMCGELLCLLGGPAKNRLPTDQLCHVSWVSDIATTLGLTPDEVRLLVRRTINRYAVKLEPVRMPVGDEDVVVGIAASIKHWPQIKNIAERYWKKVYATNDEKTGR